MIRVMCRSRGRIIDVADPGVRDRGAHEDVTSAVEALVLDILGIDTARGQEFRILSPQNPRTQDAQLTISSSRRPSGVSLVSHTSRTRH